MASIGRHHPLEELKVIANARQKPSDRFESSDENPIIRPPLERYRNNLAACSKYYNLFFLACRDTIHVYKPQGQHQILTSPEIAIPLANTDPENDVGYVSHTHPHAANHLVVADLGVEEVLVVTCDDGDVLAYTTVSIYHEIVRQASSSQDPRPPDTWTDPVRTKLTPLLHRNVGLSAWGIAVHKEARMIAVSCNTETIHVFLLALTDPEFVEPPLLLTWGTVNSGDGFLPRHRSRNFDFVLKRHANNIPSIAFYNPHKANSKDLFLVSADIYGHTYIWDVWKRRVIHQLDTSIRFLEERGWGVLCLDPYFYRHTASSQGLFGGLAVTKGASRLDITETTHARAGNDHGVSGGFVYDHTFSLGSPTEVYAAADPEDSDFDMDVDSSESGTLSNTDMDMDQVNESPSETNSLSTYQDQEPDITTDEAPSLSNAQTTEPTSPLELAEWLDDTLADPIQEDAFSTAPDALPSL
ncbi:MAG: hypothetical protein LQ352_008360, partial [Teloschistes flavicans]